jgi:hypothetical protein
MPIKTIHSFLVHPLKHDEGDPPVIGGTRVPVAKGGRLVSMLTGVYDAAETECKIDISFEPADDGTQTNVCRDLVVAYATAGHIEAGRAIAQRLQSVTTLKSGLGLLFLLLGDEDNGAKKVVISRFPADNGILADQKKGELSVQFLERVFMKRATSYKAAVYRDHSLTSGFWEGKVVDKQINSGTISVSNYWIAEFLASDFRTTSAQGSRRLADAFRNATANTKDVEVKSELIAALRLTRGQSGKSVSISGLMDQFNLSDGARTLIKDEVQDHLLKEKFRLDVAELDKHAPMHSIELDNGAVLTAATQNFDDVFRREKLKSRDGEQRIRISTEGRVVNERLRKKS